MSSKQYLIDVAITIPITFVVAAAVTFLYSFIVHGTGVVNWETAFQLAIIFGIVLPATRSLPHKEESEPQEIKEMTEKPT